MYPLVFYQDGKGGCDGCLNWEGMGDFLTFAEIVALRGKRQMPNVRETNNNGLQETVEILEEIYKNPMFSKDK